VYLFSPQPGYHEEKLTAEAKKILGKMKDHFNYLGDWLAETEPAWRSK